MAVRAACVMLLSRAGRIRLLPNIERPGADLEPLGPDPTAFSTVFRHESKVVTRGSCRPPNLVASQLGMAASAPRWPWGLRCFQLRWPVGALNPQPKVRTCSRA